MPHHGTNISELEIYSFRRRAVETFAILVCYTVQVGSCSTAYRSHLQGQAALLEIGWTGCHETSANRLLTHTL